MRIITSGGNELVKLARRLCDRRGREKEGAFLIEGENLLREARKSGAEIRVVFWRADDFAAAPEEGTMAGRLELSGGAPSVLLSARLFDEIADTVTPQAVMAVVEKPKPTAGLLRNPAGTSERPTAVVVLDRLQDPGNVGTILRTADAAGFSGLIAVKGTADIYSRKVQRAAAGAIFRIPVIHAESARETLELLREGGFRSVVCHMEGECSYDRANLRGAVALLLGNEGGGLSEELIKQADVRAFIPMSAEADSLNVAIAAAVFMFEKRRQDAE